jgi:hypothetical protein
LFAAVEKGLVICPETFAPWNNPNKPELYDRLPVPRRLDCGVNAGVIGLDRERDAGLLNVWCGLVERAFADPTLQPLISWYDQGSLIWALESLGLLDAVRPEHVRWNTCADGMWATPEGPKVRRRYHGGKYLRGELLANHPGASILHWMGRPKLSDQIDPEPVREKPAARPAAPPVQRPGRPRAPIPRTMRAH